MAELPERVAAFRREYRAKIGPRYSGPMHLAFTSVASLLAILFAASRVRSPTTAEWLMVPAGFLAANVAEYLGHKGPMHRPTPGLRALYKRHTLDHHHFFTREAMAFESTRDFKMVLFPLFVVLFFLGGIATPLSLAFYFAVSPNAGWLFAATGTAYFLTYEWLHFAYHMSEGSWVGRLPLLAKLRQHHAQHHDPALMGRYNFNITFPICDWIFGTRFVER
jgi:hypothetical protein